MTKDIYHYYKLRDDPGIHGALATVARHAATEFASLAEQIAPRIPGPPVNSHQPARPDR